MKLKHGALVIDLPDTWTDQSSLLFVAPREEQQLPTTAAVQRPTEAVAMNFLIADTDDPRAILEQQADRMRELHAGFEVLEDGPFTCGLGKGWRYIQRLTVAEVPVRQIAVACVIGPVAVVATASAAEARFQRCEKQLAAILESMRLGH